MPVCEELGVELAFDNESREELLKLLQKSGAPHHHITLFLFMVRFDLDLSRRIDLSFDHVENFAEVRIFYWSCAPQFYGLLGFDLLLEGLIWRFFLEGLFSGEVVGGLGVGPGDVEGGDEVVLGYHRITRD